MAGDTNQTLLEQIRELPRERQRALLLEIQRILSSEKENGTAPRIMELRGLGKEIWTGIDIDSYLRSERASWDG